MQQYDTETSTWQTIANTTVNTADDVSLEGIVTNNNALRLYYTSSGTSSFVFSNKIGVKSHDVVASYQTVSLASIDQNFDDDYRFGFNGQEKDNEVKGVGNSLAYEARIYDSRLATWLSLDPLKHKYPNVSAYSFGLGSPIQYKDEGGRWITDSKGRPIYTSAGAKWSAMPDNVDKDNVYLIERRTYYTNDGKAVIVDNYVAKLSKVNAQKVIDGTVKQEDVIEEVPESFKYDCHGNSTLNGENLYLPGELSAGVDNIDKVFQNKSEYTPVNEADLKKGDITTFGEGGKTNHSATYEGNGTYTSKDDRAPLRTNASLSSITSMWGGVMGHYRHNGNVDGGVDSNNGEVSNDDAQKAIRNVNPTGPLQENGKF